MGEREEAEKAQNQAQDRIIRSSRTTQKMKSQLCQVCNVKDRAAAGKKRHPDTSDRISGSMHLKTLQPPITLNTVGLSKCPTLPCLKMKYLGDFPGGPVAKTLSFQCRGPGFDPW